MAKDVSNKAASSENPGSTSPSINDQQKVPPLRIVLNTSGNQKSSSTTSADQQQDIKRDKPQDAKQADAIPVRPGGKVRIKLGTNKQAGKNSEANNKASGVEDAQKFKSSLTTGERNNKSELKEEINANHGHLRRITRRSQRAVQIVSNEDEESISSMTSTDENLNSTSNNTSDNNTGTQDSASAIVTSNANSTTTTTSTTSTSNASACNVTSSAETPRRYKRRKGEISEFQLGEHDGLFNFQNYKPPNQNSFELYKNIRQQVDKKMRNLGSINPKTPHGFRDYMLMRGSYLLDGNKLGNGTNLFMNEDGGLYPAPIGKYHALRHNRMNYTVPNRAKVPLGLPVNSPLYNLFIDQEKERYRMQMQHIKEREKLTLVAEQEIIRVYNQAAMAAANQLEPFSACTMLKHQEIYNYMDSDGFAILSREDEQHDQAKPDGDSRTRRRHHEQISPPPSRKSSNAGESLPSETSTNQRDTKTANSDLTTSTGETQKSDCDASNKSTATTKEEPKQDSATIDSEELKSSVDESNSAAKESVESADTKVDSDETSQSSNVLKVDDDKTAGTVTKIDSPISKDTLDSSEKNGGNIDSTSDEDKSKTTGEEVEEKKTEREDEKEIGEEEGKEIVEIGESSQSAEDQQIKVEPMEVGDPVEGGSDAAQNEPAPAEGTKEDANEATIKNAANEKEQDELMNASANTEIIGISSEYNKEQVPMEQDGELNELNSGAEGIQEQVLSDDDRRAYNKQVFLSQLQEIDDKWDRIRGEMLVRHKNESESLHAVQRLEWEWKTKEIGACDVRTAPIIDNMLVPKLTIYPQDY